MIKLIDLQLFPSIDYIKEFINCPNIIIEACESMQKRSFRNRYVISGANGLIGLTVPIVGGREKKQFYKDVKIDYSENWQLRHWKTLQSSYNKSPYFEHYAPALQSFFSAEEDFLFLFNYKILDWITKTLKINTLITLYDNNNKNINIESNIINKFLPNVPLNPDYVWKPKYPQVFEDRFGFLPNLSILDMLFCVGPNSLSLLKNNC